MTKYKANRSYNQWVMQLSIRPLEYDAVIYYTAELFNNFMEYKQLAKKVQDVVSHRSDYGTMKHPIRWCYLTRIEATNKINAIPTTISTLVAVRSAFRNEMNKIVAVTNTLAQKPHLLQHTSSFNVVSNDAIVRKIMQEALAASPNSKRSLDTVKVETPEGITPFTAGSNSTSDFQAVDHADVPKVGGTEVSAAAPAAAQPVAPKEPAKEPIAAYPEVEIDLSALIAPEVWADLLPVRIKGTVAEVDSTAATEAAATLFPPPPSDDAMLFLKSKSSLKILVAVCGIHDVTEVLQARVKDNALELNVSQIDGLVSGAIYATLPQPFTKNISCVYQYGDGPMQFAAAGYAAHSSNVFRIDSKVDTQLKPSQIGDWYVVAIIYGGVLFANADTQKIQDQIRKEGRATLSNQSLGRDPWQGTCKTGIIYYTSTSNGPLRVVVAAEGRGDCELTKTQQLCALETVRKVEVPKEVIKEVLVVKEVPKEVIKEVVKEVPKEVIKEVRSNQIELSGGLSSGRKVPPCRFHVLC